MSEQNPFASQSAHCTCGHREYEHEIVDGERVTCWAQNCKCKRFVAVGVPMSGGAEG